MSTTQIITICAIFVAVANYWPATTFMSWWGLLTGPATYFFTTIVSVVASLVGRPSATSHVQTAVGLVAKRGAYQACSMLPLEACQRFGIDDPDAYSPAEYAAAATCCAAVLWLAWTLVSTVASGENALVSSLINMGRDLAGRRSNLRDAFLRSSIPHSKYPVFHTHAKSAEERNSAELLAEVVGLETGHKTNHYQASATRIRRGGLGSRLYYWAKDLVSPPVGFEPSPGQMIVATDVDYYIDYPDLLSYGLPLFLYTIVPEAAVANMDDQDFAFKFVREGTKTMIDMHVAGGGHYRHQIWNHNRDVACISSVWRGVSLRDKVWNTIKPRVVVYNVERRRIAAHRSAILYVPAATVEGWLSVMSCFWARLVDKPPERFDPYVECGDQAYIRFFVNTGATRNVTLARHGQEVCATVTAAQDAQVEASAAVTVSTLPVGSVRTLVGCSLSDAQLLTNFHRESHGYKAPYVVQGPAAQNYTFLRIATDYDAKPQLVPFMKPIVNGAFVAMDTVENEEAAIAGRADRRGRTDIDLGSASNFLRQCATEFIEHLDIKGLDPVDTDAVFANQTRRTQREQLNQAATGIQVGLDRISSFLKKEAYQYPAEPRNISTTDPYTKLHYSRYTYAFSAALKKWPWYMVGRTAAEVASRVAESCVNATSHVCETDQSRMDLNWTSLMRSIWRLVMTTAFKAEYLDELDGLLESVYGRTGTAPRGTTYEQGTGMASGAPDTSVGNTTMSAIMTYFSYRLQGFDPDEAWAKLVGTGLFCGDDANAADQDADVVVRASAAFGQKAKVKTIKKGEGGLTFLARVYGPDVWTGDPVSVCDLPRTLSKFHVSRRLSGVTPERKAAEKAWAFLQNDPCVPVISKAMNFIHTKYVAENGEIDFNEIDWREVSYWAHPERKGYPQEPRDFIDVILNDLGWDLKVLERWMVDYADRTLATALKNVYCIAPDPIASKPPVAAVTVNGEPPSSTGMPSANSNAYDDDADSDDKSAKKKKKTPRKSKTPKSSGKKTPPPKSSEKSKPAPKAASSGVSVTSIAGGGMKD